MRRPTTAIRGTAALALILSVGAGGLLAPARVTMQRMVLGWSSASVLALCLAGCGGAGASEAGEPEGGAAEAAGSVVGMADALASALTFHASFDNGIDADRAPGDPRLYTAPSYEEQDQAQPGLGNPAVTVAEDAGRYGHALRFAERNEHAVFYRADGNIGYSQESWSGTVSFWLRVDPATDLAPGFTDPVQITDAAYNDAAIWVDFTGENPRQFRLGVFGDLAAWNPDGIGPNENPAFADRLTVVDDWPFAGDRWTHVAVTYAGLGRPGGAAHLYLDGERVPGGADDIDEPFTWDIDRGAIRLGVNYTGLLDELSLFDRPLTDDEVRALRALEGGVASLSTDGG